MEICVICSESLSISPFQVKAEKARENAKLRAEYCKANSIPMFGSLQRRPYGGTCLTQRLKSNFQKRDTSSFRGIENLSNPFVKGVAIITPEIIVVQECGHMSHLTCLEVRHRAFSPFNRASRMTDPVECPACGKAISLSRVRVIDFSAHDGCTDKFSKDIQYLEMMTKELEEQFHDGLSKYESTEKALHDLGPIVNGLQNRLETCQMKNYRHKMLKDTKTALIETDATLKVMQEHNITLVRTLLSILKECSSKTISAKEILPTELIPALELIKNDKTILEKLVHIVAPKKNGASPDKLTLTAEILAIVGKTSLDDRLEKFHEELKKQVTTLQKPTTAQAARISLVIPMPTLKEEEVENLPSEEKTDTEELTWIKKVPDKPHYNAIKSRPPKKSARTKMQERIKKLQKAQEKKNALVLEAVNKTEANKSTAGSQTEHCEQKLENDEPQAGQLSDSSMKSRQESAFDDTKLTVQNEKQENDKALKEDETKLKLLFARRLANGGDPYNIISSTLNEMSNSSCIDSGDDSFKPYYNITRSQKSGLPPTTSLLSEQSDSDCESASDQESKCPSDSEIQSIINGLRTVSTQTLEAYVQPALLDHSITENSSQSSQQHVQDPYNTFMETPVVCGKLQVKKQSCSFWIPNKTNSEISNDKGNTLNEPTSVNQKRAIDELNSECGEKEQNVSCQPSIHIPFECSNNNEKNMSKELIRKISSIKEMYPCKDIAPEKSIMCTQCHSQWCVESKEKNSMINVPWQNKEQEIIVAQNSSVMKRNSAQLEKSVREVNKENCNTDIPHFNTNTTQAVRNEDFKTENSNHNLYPVTSTGFNSKHTLLVTNERNNSQELIRKTSNNIQKNNSSKDILEKSLMCMKCHSQWGGELKEKNSTINTNSQEKVNARRDSYSNFTDEEQEITTRQTVMKQNSVRELSQGSCNTNIQNSNIDFTDPVRNEACKIGNSNNNLHPAPSSGFNSKDTLLATNFDWKVMVPPPATNQPGVTCVSSPCKANLSDATTSYDSIKTYYERGVNNDYVNNNSSPGISTECSREILLDQTESLKKVYTTFPLHSTNDVKNIWEPNSQEEFKNSQIRINVQSMKYENEEEPNASESIDRVEKRKELQVSPEMVNISRNVAANPIKKKSSREFKEIHRRPETSAFVPQNSSFTISIANDDDDKECSSSDATITITKKGEEKTAGYPSNVIPNSQQKNTEIVVTPLSPKPTFVVADKNNRKRSSKTRKIVPLVLVDSKSSQSRGSSNSNDSIINTEDERKLISKFINKHFHKKHVKSEKRQSKKSNVQSRQTEQSENVTPRQQQNYFIPLGQVVQLENIQQLPFQFQAHPSQLFASSTNSNNSQFLSQNEFERPENLTTSQQIFFRNSPEVQTPFSARPSTIVQIVPDRNFVYDPYSMSFPQEPTIQSLQINQQQTQPQFFPFASLINPVGDQSGQHFCSTSSHECLGNEPFLMPNKTTEFLEHVSKMQEDSSIPLSTETLDVENICRWLSPPPSPSIRFDNLRGDEPNELYCYEDPRSVQRFRNEVHSTPTRTIMNNEGNHIR